MRIKFGITKMYHMIGLFNLFCYYCKKNTLHTGGLLKTAATLFWVPIFPLGTNKRIRCTKCYNESQIMDFPHDKEIDLNKPGSGVSSSSDSQKSHQPQPSDVVEVEPIIVEVEPEEIPPPPPPPPPPI